MRIIKHCKPGEAGSYKVSINETEDDLSSLLFLSKATTVLVHVHIFLKSYSNVHRMQNEYILNVFQTLQEYTHVH